MDLSDFKPASDTVIVELYNELTGEPIPNDGRDTNMSVTLYAPHSEEYRAVEYEQQNRMFKKAQKEGKKAEFTAQEFEENVIERFARITKEWDITYKGTNPSVSVDLAKEIYRDYFWIKKQLDEGLANSLNFTNA